jgi:hypothetical protein
MGSAQVRCVLVQVGVHVRYMLGWPMDASGCGIEAVSSLQASRGVGVVSLPAIQAGTAEYRALLLRPAFGRRL